jgi:hypothetical protein
MYTEGKVDLALNGLQRATGIFVKVGGFGILLASAFSFDDSLVCGKK